MSIMILSPREPKTLVTYRREFTYEDGNGGFSFPCDEKGTVELTSDAAKQNYEYALAHPEEFPVQFNELVTYKNSYIENARAKCHCGEEIELWDQYQGACNCPKCGRWYNMFGQDLIDPEYWEEDED